MLRMPYPQPFGDVEDLTGLLDELPEQARVLFLDLVVFRLEPEVDRHVGVVCIRDVPPLRRDDDSALPTVCAGRRRGKGAPQPCEWVRYRVN